MPLPKPKKDEGKADFLDRCMGDEAMEDEYPDNKQRYAVCNSLWKNKNKRGEDMAIKLNSKGRANCKKMISAGKIDKDSAWSFSAEDSNAILGKDDWKEYAKWFLAIDDGFKSDTKEHYKYPFGKGGKIYRSALVAIRQRAGQQDEDELFDAAGQMIEMCDGKEKKSFVDVERRFLPMTDSEVRIVEDEKDPPRLVGYFAKFGRLSENLGGFREQIDRGFFEEAIQKSDTVDLFNHDPNYILGRKSAGTLKVWEDEVGLRFECLVPQTQIIKDLVLAPIKRGDIKGCSFGFKVKKGGDKWDENEEGVTIRTLIKGGCASLVDGSQVTFPAYQDTQLALRSLDGWKEKKELQDQELQRLKQIEEVRKMNLPTWYIPIDKRASEFSLDKLNSILWDAVSKQFSEGEGENRKPAWMQEAFLAEGKADSGYLVFQKDAKFLKTDWFIKDGEVVFGDEKIEVEKTWKESRQEQEKIKSALDLKRKKLMLKEKEIQ